MSPRRAESTPSAELTRLSRRKLLDAAYRKKQASSPIPGADVRSAPVEVLTGVSKAMGERLRQMGAPTVEAFARSNFELGNARLENIRSRVADALAESGPAGLNLSVSSTFHPLMVDLQVADDGRGFVLSGHDSALQAYDTAQDFWERQRISIQVGGDTVVVRGLDIFNPHEAMLNPLVMIRPGVNLIGAAVIGALNDKGHRASWGNDVLGGTLINVES
jgi:hypothetical protein